MPPLRVFLVDEHEVVRIGVAHIVADADGMEVVGEASSVLEALNRVPAAKPDVTVVGSIFHISSGIELCRDLANRYPPLKVLMLTAEQDDEAMVAAFLAGAAGYVDKTTTVANLVESIRVVGSGSSLLDARSTAAIIDRLRNPLGPEVEPFAELTPGELRVLELISEGLTNDQIAERMVIATPTVKNHCSKIFLKLHVTSRTQAAMAYTAEHHEDSAPAGL